MDIKAKHRPIYLHFLDRELRRAEKAELSDAIVTEAVILSVLSTESYCYCSTSLLYENSFIFPKSINLLLELEKNGFVRLLTNEHSYDEFISFRQKIYSHKRERYPMYFKESTNPIWALNPLIVETSTTMELRKNMQAWLGDSSSNSQYLKESFDVDTLNKFDEKLYREKEKAITLDLFLNDEELSIDFYRRNTGRMISFFYTKRHIDLYNGDILNGLPSLKFFDRLSINKILNNYFLTKKIISLAGIPDIFYINGELQQTIIISFLCHNVFKYIQSELFSILYGLNELLITDFKNDFTALNNIVLEKIQPPRPKDYSDINQQIQNTFINLLNINSHLNKFDTFFKAYQMAKTAITSTKKILIVVATDLEARVFLQIMERHGNTGKNFEVGKHVYWNMGVINNSEIIMIKSSMGSSGASGSTLTIKEAIDHIKPNYVIMIGIAFGLKKKKQEIGRILVSRQLENYEASKVTDGATLQRGDKISAGVTLMHRFDNSALTFKQAQVETGLMISGEKLSDSIELIDRLKTSYPEAIGGEMEGTGLQSSAYRENIEWILIKGICDWGYNKQTPRKEAHQELAITNVCNFLIHTLKNFTF